MPETPEIGGCNPDCPSWGVEDPCVHPTHTRPETPETAPAFVTINPVQAAERAYAAGQAQWYLSGGEKIEFTGEGFVAWYTAEVAMVRAKVAEEIRAEAATGSLNASEYGSHENVLEAARIARGEQP